MEWTLMTKKICLMVVAVIFLSLASPVLAQTPTPVPTPTPQIVHGEDGDFVIVAEVSYGQGGVIVALVLVAGLQLMSIMLRVVEWFKR